MFQIVLVGWLGIVLNTRKYDFALFQIIDIGEAVLTGNALSLMHIFPYPVLMHLHRKRYDGAEAAAAGIIQVTCPGWPDLLQKGINKGSWISACNIQLVV